MGSKCPLGPELCIEYQYGPKKRTFAAGGRKYKRMGNELYFIVQMEQSRHIWSQNDRQDQGYLLISKMSPKTSFAAGGCKNLNKYIFDIFNSKSDP